MSSDRSDFGRALELWDDHQDAKNYSISPEQGTVAILSPCLDMPQRVDVSRFPAYESMALTLADSYRSQGKVAEVALQAEPVDFKAALCDPTISDIIVIGHGCLSSVEVPNPGSSDRLDWEDLQQTADHLKTGKFIQRMCGTLPRHLNVPLGLMVVSNHRNVEAAVGQAGNIATVGVEDGVIRPVTDMTRMSYGDIKESFPQRKLPITSQLRVIAGAAKAATLSRGR